jgi:hypothetical protein
MKSISYQYDLVRNAHTRLEFALAVHKMWTDVNTGDEVDLEEAK